MYIDHWERALSPMYEKVKVLHPVDTAREGAQPSFKDN